MNKVFDNNWFAEHQQILVGLSNHPMTKGWFRKSLRIQNDCSPYEQIIQLQPNNYKILTSDHQIKADFRTHDKLAKRLYYSYSPLWNLAHQWDMLIANPLNPKWNLGFDTLTVYPDANPESTSVDGYTEVVNADWATARGAASGSANDSAASYSTYCTADLNLGTYTITRPFWLFDTSSLGAGATISAGVASFAAAGGASTNADTTAMHIVAGTPASNTAIVGDDYDQIGSTTFGNITIASWVTTNNTYNDITLNADGRSAISKTGITKFAGRLALDLNNVTPTGNNYIGSGYFADNAGTGSDPKLVVTYTPAPNTIKDILQMGLMVPR